MKRMVGNGSFEIDLSKPQHHKVRKAIGHILFALGSPGIFGAAYIVSFGFAADSRANKWYHHAGGICAAVIGIPFYPLLYLGVMMTGEGSDVP